MLWIILKCVGIIACSLSILLVGLFVYILKIEESFFHKKPETKKSKHTEELEKIFSGWRN